MSADDRDQPDLFGGVEEKPPRKAEKPAGMKKPEIKPLSKVKRRLLKSSVDIEMNPPEAIAFQHTVLCQTSLPYRDPGANVFEWERKQGAVSLLVNACKVRNPDTGEWLYLGLPFGPKPRLILAHLNAEAIKTGSPVIEVDDSLTAFVHRIQTLGRDAAKSGPNGYQVRTFKEHLSRLSASLIQLVVVKDGRSFQVDSKIVEAFELWHSKSENQRVLWPSTIRLNQSYFESLQNHAVPLDERSLGALGHSAMALDIYAWLAQRLHRVPKGQPQFITWAAVKEQFGPGYGRMDKFKAVFRVAMKQVLVQYLAARVEEDGRGLTLRNSPPPVARKLYLVHKPVC